MLCLIVITALLSLASTEDDLCRCKSLNLCAKERMRHILGAKKEDWNYCMAMCSKQVGSCSALLKCMYRADGTSVTSLKTDDHKMCIWEEAGLCKGADRKRRSNTVERTKRFIVPGFMELGFVGNGEEYGPLQDTVEYMSDCIQKRTQMRADRKQASADKPKSEMDFLRVCQDDLKCRIEEPSSFDQYRAAARTCSTDRKTKMESAEFTRCLCVLTVLGYG